MPKSTAGSVAALLAISSSLVAGCAQDGERLQVPEAPPETLEALSESISPDSGTFPPASERVRQGPCGIRLSVAPEPLLTTEGVRRMQDRLARRGLLDEGAYQPGELDAPTLQALRALQDESGLPDVGLPTYATVRALELEPSQVFDASAASDATCAGKAP